MKEENNNIEGSEGFYQFTEKVAPHIRTLLQNWKSMVIINGVVLIISVVILLLFVRNYYDSTVVILPDYGGSGMLGSLSSLAAVAGLNVGETAPTMIYQNLLEGENVLESVIKKKYSTKEYTHPVTLIEYYDIELNGTNENDSISLQERDKFLQMVKIFKEKMLFIDYDRNTSILTVTVRTYEQALSSEVVNDLVASLDEFVRTKRKSNAKEQRLYIEKRTDQVKDSLRITEEALKIFREKNHIVTSPQLLLDQARMMRDVEILQTVFIELTKQLELIKLEEVKDAPIVNIREEAGIPIKKSGPKRSIYIIVIMLISIFSTSLSTIYNREIIYYYNHFLKSIK